MLTKGDLVLMRKVVREEVESEVQNAKIELQSELKITRMGIREELHQVSDRVKNLEITTKNKFKTVEKKLDKAIGFLDKHTISVEKRVERIEEHLKIPVVS
jgi:hypothetical protein